MRSLGRNARPCSPKNTGAVVWALWLGAAVVSVSAAFPSLTVPARYLFLVGAVAVAINMASVPGRFLTFVLTVFMTQPLVRRLLDQLGGYVQDSVVLLAAPLAAAAFLARPGHRGSPMSVSNQRYVFFLSLPLLYALLVGMTRYGVSGPLSAFIANWSPLPMAVAYALTRGPDALEDVGRVLRSFARAGLVLIAAYGVFQYFFLPSWDRSWIFNVGHVGDWLVDGVHPKTFGSLNSPGTYAMVLTLGVLLFFSPTTRSGRLARRDGVRYPSWELLPPILGGLALALTLVRSAWLSLLLGVSVAALTRRPKALMAMVFGLILASALLAAVPRLLEAVVVRVSSSLAAGTNDGSLQFRISFYLEMLPRALLNLVGNGLGATGSTARLSGESATVLADFDGGYVETLYVLGGIFGIVFLAMVLSGIAGARGSVGTRHVTFAVVLMMLFSNPLTSAPGYLLGLFIATQRLSNSRIRTNANPANSRARGV